MNIYEMKWTNEEKKIARKAFDNAYKREMKEIKSLLFEKVSSLKTDSDLWAIEDYLNDRRKVVNEKYDYRYSQLIVVFSRLLSEGYLSEEDIKELGNEKKEIIKNLSSQK